MSATPVSICSNALLMLGDNPIADFSEGSDKARLASNLWPFARDALLRRHPWNCAVKRVALAPDETAPPFDYSKQFTLPADFLRLLSIGLEGERPRYRVEGGKLLMDETVCRLRYIWRNDNPATWDSLLVETATMVMRELFAYPVTQSGSMEQLITSTVQRAIREARAVDGQEDEPEAFDESPLIAAGYIGSGYASRYRGT